MPLFVVDHFVNQVQRIVVQQLLKFRGCNLVGGQVLSIFAVPVEFDSGGHYPNIVSQRIYVELATTAFSGINAWGLTPA